MSDNFYKRLPKIELHAHLHGCIRQNTIIELYSKKQNKENTNELRELLKGKRTLRECFRLFDIIHDVIETEEHLRRITKEVVEDFANDGVIYAEIRTTPRKFSIGGSLTEKEGIDVIIEEIKNMEHLLGDRIMIRIILSINRSESLDKALRTAQMAINYKQCGEDHVVGVDLSGNPTGAPFVCFKEAFDLLKRNGIPTVIHTGEVSNDRVFTSPCSCDLVKSSTVHCDTADIIAFHPNRLGHALCLKEEDKQAIIKESIPIEICPSSNLMTMSLSSIKEHPVLSGIAKDIPFSINTDDTVVFDVTLSDEVELVSETFGWDRKKVILLMEDEGRQILDCSALTKEWINQLFESFKNKYIET